MAVDWACHAVVALWLARWRFERGYLEEDELRNGDGNML